MARSHGKIHADIWRNRDWWRLSESAQRTYFLLLSQPKLTLCGSLDLAVAKWARLAADTSVASIDQALAELEAAGFIVMDGEVDELVIRTFTKHDINPARFNKNLAKGLWHAWTGLVSDELRKVVVREIPDDLWEKVAEHAPEGALICRDLTPRETNSRDHRWRPFVETTSRNDQFEPNVQEA